MNIGSRLKQILEERCLNVSQLARNADIPAQTLYAMIKRDSNKADMDIMAKLLRALDMEFMEFMGQDWQKAAGENVKNPKSEEKKPASEEKVPDSKSQEPKGERPEHKKQDKEIENLKNWPQDEVCLPEKKVRRRKEMEDYLL